MAEINAFVEGLRRQFWESPDTFGSVLLLLLVDHCGKEALDWHPATIRATVEDDFLGGAPRDEDGHHPLPDSQYGKLMAAVTVATTDLFRRSCHGFRCLCVALNGGGLDTDTVEFPDAAEVAWGLTEGALIDPPAGDEHFAPDVESFVAETARRDGLYDPPDVMKLGHDGGPDLARWADRPDVLAAVRVESARRSRGLVAGLRAAAGALTEQLEKAPLLTGSCRAVAKRLRGALKAPGEKPKPGRPSDFWDFKSIFTDDD